MTEPTPEQIAFQRASHRQLHNIGVVPRMSQDERRKFVIDWLAGRVFTSAHVRDHGDLRMIFMPLGLFPVFANWEEDDLKKIGVIWEYTKEAGPRSINGYPCFFSLRIMHREDWDRCAAAIDREQDRQQDIEV